MVESAALPVTLTSPMPELEFDLTLYPAPVLRRVASPVEAFDDELHSIVEAMYRRMYASKGVGLAAPQVGLKKRILVLSPTGEEGDQQVLINPTILEKSGPSTLFEEGCLSFPGIYAEIERPELCKVRAFDLEGNEHELEFDGFASRIVQHEYDHLEGILLVDRMSPADKQRHKTALDNLVFDFKQAREKRARAARRP